MVGRSFSPAVVPMSPLTTVNVQVQFKRKPVQFLPVPDIDDEQQEVCLLPSPRPPPLSPEFTPWSIELVSNFSCY